MRDYNTIKSKFQLNRITNSADLTMYACLILTIGKEGSIWITDTFIFLRKLFMDMKALCF